MRPVDPARVECRKPGLIRTIARAEMSVSKGWCGRIGPTCPIAAEYGGKRIEKLVPAFNSAGMVNSADMQAIFLQACDDRRV
jgi:hypothetical protein